MNDEVKSKTVSKTEKAPEKSSAKSRAAFGLWLPVLISLLAMGLSALVYLQLNKMKLDSNTIQPGLSQLELKVTRLEDTLSEAQQHSEQLRARIDFVQQQQADLAAGQAAISRQQGKGDNDWSLAEIEQLLIIAMHRLQLESDVPMALAAMRAADDRLRDNDDPRILPLRRQLTADMNALKAVKAVDISGLSLFLSDLVGRVNNLPLQQAKVIETARKDQDKQAQGKSSKWERLKSSVWQELKSLVLISRRGDETIATLMPEQQYFLYQNLRLQLESARYAVLRRDTANLHISVEIIRSWLEDYFDTSDTSVGNILETLEQMAKLELSPPLPDISSSLQTLRAYLSSHDEQKEIIQSPVPVPESEE